MNLKTGLMALLVIGSLLAIAPTASATCQAPVNEQEMVECAAAQQTDNVWEAYYELYDCLTGGPCVFLPQQ